MTRTGPLHRLGSEMVKTLPEVRGLANGNPSPFPLSFMSAGHTVFGEAGARGVRASFLRTCQAVGSPWGSAKRGTHGTRMAGGSERHGSSWWHRQQHPLRPSSAVSGNPLSSRLHSLSAEFHVLCPPRGWRLLTVVTSAQLRAPFLTLRPPHP